jgi:pimeloyl-ACP methyl ester carboxylesterase
VRAEPFRVAIDERVLDDLRERIARTRWPEAAPGEPWAQGTDLAYLRDLLDYWADGFDWGARERELNAFAHFRAEIDGVRIHFVHERARDGNGIPLILTHGWPSAFVELLPLVPLLTDPPDGPSFDLVIPSLPGYGFSPRPARTGVHARFTAGLWHRLMQGLGYERYGAHGGDWGASVSTFMALDDPGPMLGLHLGNLDNRPYTGPGSRELTAAERAYVTEFGRWLEDEHAYAEQQATKPQTLAYALNDSPAGLAAWIVEKWRAWADTGGDVERRFTRDHLLTVVTLYWVTATIATSMRDYYDERWSPEATIGPDDFVAVPTAMAVFYANFIPEGVPPREWVERLYNVQRWTPMLRGGHFPAVEEPELLARDIAAFFGELGPPSTPTPGAQPPGGGTPWA